MISYAITVKDELKELETLINKLKEYKGENDEIVVIRDSSFNSEDIKKYLENKDYIKSYDFLFKNDFSEFKNFMNSCCTKEWIFNLDADELPHDNLLNSIHEILQMNENVDAVWIPRINIVHGITYEHIKQWGWVVNEHGWINWPHDAQCRIYKNNKDIKWTKKVHEQLTGYKTISKLPDAEELSIYHLKNIEKQEKQNNYYSTNKNFMKIVKYNNYEVKSVETTEEYEKYVNLQSGRSGINVNHNNFIEDISKFIDKFNITLYDNIIDVGCRGNALILLNLRNNGYTNVYGTDIGYEAELQWKNLPIDLQKNIRRADIHDGIPFDVKFKVITCSHVLEHCFDPEKVVKNFYDSLEDNGLLHLQIPLSKYNDYINHAAHYAFWTDDTSFEKWILNLGFDVVQSINSLKVIRNVANMPDDYCIILKKIKK